MKNRIVTGESPEIVIEVIEGDAAVRGWPHPEVYIAIDPSKLQVEQVGNRVTLQLRGDAGLQVPAGCNLTIERVEGDIAVNGITGTLALGRVNGDAAVRRIGTLKVEHIEGDLAVRSVEGDCTVERVRSDAAVAGVKGTLRIAAGDDLDLRGMRGLRLRDGRRQRIAAPGAGSRQQLSGARWARILTCASRPMPARR